MGQSINSGERMSITKSAIDRLKRDERFRKEQGQAGKTHYLWDTDPIGFGVRITPAGAISYIYQFRMGGRGSQVRREVIGRVEKIAPEQARARARDLAYMARMGTDPIEKKKADRKAKAEAKLTAEQLAFDRYCNRYLEKRVRAEKLASEANIEMVFRLHAVPVLRDKPLMSLTKRDFVEVLDTIPAASLALRRSVYAILNRMMNWAVERGDIAANPMSGMKRPSAPPSRDRVLSDDELALLLRALNEFEPPFGPFDLLLLATGARRDEIAALDWSEVDRPSASWGLPAARAKNDEFSIRPLNKHAVAVLDRVAGLECGEGARWPRQGLVFSTTGSTPLSGFSRSKARLDARIALLARQDAERAGIDPDLAQSPCWRRHDARRTIATNLQRLGVRFEVVEALLTHTAGASRSGIAAVYQRWGWGPEKREASDLWSACLDAILAGHRQSDFASKEDREGLRGWQVFIKGWVNREGPPFCEHK